MRTFDSCNLIESCDNISQKSDIALVDSSTSQIFVTFGTRTTWLTCKEFEDIWAVLYKSDVVQVEKACHIAVEKVSVSVGLYYDFHSLTII
jgi:hypothetical protein